MSFPCLSQPRLTWVHAFAAAAAIHVAGVATALPSPCRDQNPDGTWECTVHPLWKPAPPVYYAPTAGSFYWTASTKTPFTYLTMEEAIADFKNRINLATAGCGGATLEIGAPTNYSNGWNFNQGYTEVVDWPVTIRWAGANCPDTVLTGVTKWVGVHTCGWHYNTTTALPCCSGSQPRDWPSPPNGDPWQYSDTLYSSPTRACFLRDAVGDKCSFTGNPVSTHTGVKVQNETDLNWSFEDFSRIYKTFSEVGVPGVDPAQTSDTMGRFWRHRFERYVGASSDTPGAGGVIKYARVLREGDAHYFFGTGVTANGEQIFTPRREQNDRLVAKMDAQGAITQWVYTDENDAVETYGADGRLLSIKKRNGVTATLSYQTVAGVPRPLLSLITDSFGRTLSFTYYPSTQLNGGGKIQSVTDHLGNMMGYEYDADGNLTKAIYPGSQPRIYFYSEIAHSVPNRNANLLTGITDENGARYATYKYDATSRAYSTEHAGGANKYTFVFSATRNYVTDPLGVTRAIEMQNVSGIVKTTSVDQPCPTCGVSNAQAMTYDANGNVASRTDFNSKKSCYAYDLVRNLETARVEGLNAGADCATELAKAVTAFTAPDQKKVQTTWHATYRLPLTITEPAAGTTVGGVPGTKLTEFTYDASGNMLTRKVTAPKNDGTSATEIRTWTYTYNSLGQPLTAKDPLNQTTTTVYYAATDTANPPKYTKGDVQTITNAAGHVVTMNEYDRNGRATKMTDANGLITTMAYHPRGWLSSRSVSNGTTTETTFYTYDKAGQLTRVTMPDGANLFYAYDAAHRLVGMSDQLTGVSPQNTTVTLNPPGGTATTVTVQNLIVGASNLTGNKIRYTLDNMGNRIKEEHFDPSGTLQKQKQRAIDALNRLKQDIGGTAYAGAAPAGAPTVDPSVASPPSNAAITQYGYDANGNLTSTIDPLGRTTSNLYDALNRLTKVFDPYNGTTKPTVYQYDASNNLVQVTDPQGLSTTYTYNGHNNLITQASPDTGTTRFKYNAAGNLVAKIDSVNRCTTTAYDSLNRPTTIKYYAATNTSTNTQALCFGTIAGTVVVEETHTYTYDSITATLGGPGGKGRLSRIADASGTIDYTYDLFGRVTSKKHTLSSNTTQNGGATNLTKNVTYRYNAAGQLIETLTPSGQLIAYSYGAPNSANPGKVTGIKVNGVDIAKGIGYKPFGPVQGWTWGNDNNPPPGQSTGNAIYFTHVHGRDFDLDYRPIIIDSYNSAEAFEGLPANGYSRDIAWDRGNRINAITVPAGYALPGLSNAQSLDQIFAYDQLDRLTQFNAGVSGATTAANGMALLPNEIFTYDGIGNRKSRTTQAPGTTGTQSTSYTHGSTPTTANKHWLIQATGQLPNNWAYDASGNALFEANAQMWGGYGSSPGAPASLSYTLTSTGTQARAIAYAYDAKNRLSKVSLAPANSTQASTQTSADTVTYRINALGQRVQKIGAGIFAPNASPTNPFVVSLSNPPTAAQLQTLNAQTTAFYANSRFIYDEQGRLLGEYAKDGKLIQEIVWFNDLPIAVLKPKGANVLQPTSGTGTTGSQGANNTGANGNTSPVTSSVYTEIFYVHPDHLGTPRAITTSVALAGFTIADNRQVWRWDSDPFGTSLGNSTPNENPSAFTQLVGATTLPYLFAFDNAFPGQKRDRETGKHYNYFRDYDPSSGRYAESDPIGLRGGISTYGYVRQRPLSLRDKYGLATFICQQPFSWNGSTLLHSFFCDERGVCRGFGPPIEGDPNPGGIWRDDTKAREYAYCQKIRTPHKCIEKALDECISSTTGMTEDNPLTGAPFDQFTNNCQINSSRVGTICYLRAVKQCAVGGE